MAEIKIDKTHLGCFGKQKTKIKPVAIVIHHTCTTSPKRTRKALMNKGCSTHFEVDKDGTIYQYREEDLMCSHCGSANIHTIGIDVTHMEHAEFPPEQVRAVQDLVEYLCDKWQIPHVVNETLSGIYPHRALGSTVCPDNFPMERLGFKEFVAYLSDSPAIAQTGVTKDFDSHVRNGNAIRTLYEDQAMTIPIEYDDSFEYEIGFYCPCTGKWIKYPSIQSLDGMPAETVSHDPEMGQILLDIYYPVEDPYHVMRLWYVCNLNPKTPVTMSARLYGAHPEFTITQEGYENFTGTCSVSYDVTPRGSEEPTSYNEIIQFVNGKGSGTALVSLFYTVTVTEANAINRVEVTPDSSITIRARYQ